MQTWNTNQQVVFYTHLAFVCAIVSFLYVFYLQCPIVRSFGVQHGEPFIVCVREHARGQDVPVPAADPRYLEKKKKNISVSSDQTPIICVVCVRLILYEHKLLKKKSYSQSAQMPYFVDDSIDILEFVVNH